MGHSWGPKALSRGDTISEILKLWKMFLASSGEIWGFSVPNSFCGNDVVSPKLWKILKFVTIKIVLPLLILRVLDFLDYVYGVFGFTFEVELSTRPENKLGTDEMWDQAERALANCLTKFCDKHKETIKVTVFQLRYWGLFSTCCYFSLGKKIQQMVLSTDQKLI